MMIQGKLTYGIAADHWLTDNDINSKTVKSSFGLKSWYSPYKRMWRIPKLILIAQKQIFIAQN